MRTTWSIAFVTTVLALCLLACVGVGDVGAAQPIGAEMHRRTVVFGHSLRGRPLVAQVLGADTAPRKILLVGCIHGNECAGRAILSSLARRAAPAGVQLWLVLSVNPDGETDDTRQDARGVDLNRNFPYQWRHVTGPTYYSGPRPLSEPETRAAVRLIARVKPNVTVWYHQHEDL
ncbi:MAG TPA: DUF2817 domain-containing protein, partial [Solirubrobacteraceae bacterium]